MCIHRISLNQANCGIDEPSKLCLYDETKGKILKTVDSVYQAIASKEDCEDLCNNAPFRCHSYDFNDTGDNVCRYDGLDGAPPRRLIRPCML